MAAAESHPSWKHLVLLLILVVATAGMVVGVEIRVGSETGVREVLPDTLGNRWTGDDVLFCQSPTCGRSWLTRDVPASSDGSRTCPEDWQRRPCGHPLNSMSLGEAMVLPRDTLILKKQYVRTDAPEDTVFCSVVFSGKDRTSIHRPENCMVGQGHEVEESRVLEVPLPGRDPLKVMVLHLVRRISQERMQHTYYAYWFVGKDRETPYHMERAAWMAWDRIFKSITHRWAYIAVSGDRDPDLKITDHFDEIREVVGALYPQITLVDPS